MKAQKEDKFLSKIVEFLKFSKLPNCDNPVKESIIKHAKDSFVGKNDCLYKYVGPYEKPWEEESRHWRIWIPQTIERSIMTYFHSGLPGCHLGVHKTFHKVAQRFWWQHMRKSIVKFVLSCHECQSVKARRTGPQGIGSSSPVKAPWDTITIDLIGPYVRSSNSNIHCLVVVDLFSKWVEMFPIRKATATVIIKKLHELCCRWGFPRVILSDNGPQFISSAYKNWCIGMSIKSYFIAPYHPNANPTERYNQTIKSMIVATISQCKDWDKYVHEIAFALRTSINDSTKFTPCYLNTGREFRNPIDNALELQTSHESNVSDYLDRMSIVLTLAKANLISSQEKYLANYNKNRKRVEFEVGDLVWKKTHELSDKSKKITASLLPKYEGPFTVIGKIKSDTYDLALSTNSKSKLV